MILICQNLQNKLQHPNEYLRGVTLRFLCRLPEPELLEPLIPSVLSNLEHRHPFVHRHALLAIAAIYRLPQGEQLLFDAPETVERAIASEQDPSAHRNAFLMLCHCDQDRAVTHLLAHVDAVANWGELMQMVALDLVRKACDSNRADKGRYIKIIISVLAAPSAAVVYSRGGAKEEARRGAGGRRRLVSGACEDDKRGEGTFIARAVHGPGSGRVTPKL